MDTDKRLNSYPYKDRIQMSGRSAGVSSSDVVHDKFHHNLKLLKGRRLKLMSTESLDGNSGISEVSSLKALKGCMYLMFKKTGNAPVKDASFRRTENFPKSKSKKLISN